jgi:RHS repeat-associated protein
MSILAQFKKTSGNPTLSYFFNDDLGSKREVLDSSGNVTETFKYTAFGKLSQGSASNASFTGKQYDSTGLIYFNARYYDPISFRFLQEDPSMDGTGWYTYCGNNPINIIDPNGKKGWWSDIWAKVESYLSEEILDSEGAPTGFTRDDFACSAVISIYYRCVSINLSNSLAPDAVDLDYTFRKPLGPKQYPSSSIYVMNAGTKDAVTTHWLSDNVDYDPVAATIRSKRINKMEQDAIAAGPRYYKKGTTRDDVHPQNLIIVTKIRKQCDLIDSLEGKLSYAQRMERWEKWGVAGAESLPSIKINEGTRTWTAVNKLGTELAKAKSDLTQMLNLQWAETLSQDQWY